MNDYSELIQTAKAKANNYQDRLHDVGEETRDIVWWLTDALEAMTAENTRLKEYRKANEQETISRLAIENTKLKDTNKALKSDNYNLNMNLEHITAELAELRETQRWIAVEEALPTWRDGKVLVFTTYGISVCERTTSNRWKGQHACWITHWRPLPEPPQKGE